MSRPVLSPPLFSKSGKRLWGRNTEVACQHCGTSFRVRVSTIKQGNGKYCSLACNAKAHPDQFGERTHRWTKEEAAIVSRLGGKAAGHPTRKDKPYRHRHPERTRAHRAAGNAMRAGRLVKQPCSVCGRADRVHAHHEDYSKRLDVIWLCPQCHVDHHKVRKALVNA